MKDRLFYWLMQKAGVEPYHLLPKWARAIRWVMFPLQTTRWMLEDREGYDHKTDTWKIAGMSWSHQFFVEMATGKSDWFRAVGNENGRILFEVKPRDNLSD